MGLFNLFKKEPNLPFDRINIIVLDSVGIGETYDSAGYEDDGANTLKHALECSIHKLDNLNKLGLKNLLELKEEKASAYHAELHPKSAGKETLTGHWEMMGVYNKEPLPSFTLNGFPSEMIKELERQTGYKFIGNCSASGTEIIERLGAEHIQNRSLILYTSADSVLQIAAHEQIIPVTELYRVCEIARKVSHSKPKWTVGRVIARPFIGKPGAFTRTSNRHDYALDPNGRTVLEDLIEKKYEVISVGKIADIFNNK